MRTYRGKRVYPLTAAQKLHFFTLRHCPKKQVLNIGTSLTIEQELDQEVLKEAIRQAYGRCDAMRLRFVEGKDGVVYQYVADKEERKIELADFSGWSEEEVTKRLREWTEIPFERFDSPMNRLVIIRMPDGFEGMYLLVDHMTMDAQALIAFLKDVIEIYCHIKYEGIDYPKPMAPYIPQLKKDLEYEAGNSAQKRDAAFFRQLIEESEPIFCDLEGTRRLERERKRMQDPGYRAAVCAVGSVDAGIETFHLEEEPSRQLMEFCETYRVPMVCLLLMGLRTYLQKENGFDDVSVNTTVARRATLAEKKCGGTRIHCFPFRTVISKDSSFLDGIRMIQQGQNRIFRHANYNSVHYYEERGSYYGLKPEQTYEPMSLTYQPMTLKNNGLDKLGDIRYKSAWYSNGAAAQNLYLTVMHRAADNGLDFNFEYQTGAVTKKKLEYVYYYLCRILFKGVENPECSVGELIAGV